MSNRILDYPEATAITSNDYILLDNEGTGAKCIKASALNINMDNYTIKEARGAIASFDDGEDLPLAFMGAYIEAVQSGSGDPSPSNIRPIIGWDEVNVTRCGKNLLDVSNAVNATNVVDSVEADGTIHFKDVMATWSNTHIGKIYVVKGQTYVISASNIQYGRFGFSTSPTTHPTNSTFPNIIIQSGASPSWIIGRVPTTRYFVANLTGYIYLFYCTDANYDSYHATFAAQIQIEIGETATTYEPYNGQTYNIDLDGTRYGGTLDVVSGVLTVDRAYVDLGTLDWQYSSIGEIFYVRATDLGVKATDVSTPFNAISSALIAKSYNEIDAETVDNAIGINPNATQFFARCTSITSASAFITAMNGVQLVYELATPLTIQLTPSAVVALEGENNISADSGNVVVAYRKHWNPPTM